jgi:hypothetical protein
MKREELAGEKIFVLHDFLSREECERFITVSEQIGYEDAPITTAGGFEMRKDIRNNDRVMLDEPDLATAWWERAKDQLPRSWETRWQAIGFNERFRYYRYDPGQRFAPHSDGPFVRNQDERSYFTFMVYLNEGFEGGETLFHQSVPPVIVRPESGKALVFYHRQLHEGAPVRSGRKYVLRTDLMFRKMAPSGG